MFGLVKQYLTCQKKVVFKDNLCLPKKVDHENIKIINEVFGTTIETQMWGFYTSNRNETEYFNTLSICKWRYDEFLIFAFVFCIKNTLKNEILLKSFSYKTAQYFGLLFLKENLLSNLLSKSSFFYSKI